MIASLVSKRLIIALCKLTIIGTHYTTKSSDPHGDL